MPGSLRKELAWSITATAGMVAALAGWMIDRPDNTTAQILTWCGYVVSMAAIAAAYTHYGRRTAAGPPARGDAGAGMEANNAAQPGV